MTSMMLLDEERQILLAIFAQYVPQYDVYAFGSRVTGTSKPFSDIDLVILSNTIIPAAMMDELKQAFDDSQLPFKVDVLDWASISPAFKSHIQSGWVKFASGKPA